MIKSIDEKIIGEAIKSFIKSNPDLVMAWVAETYVEGYQEKPLFSKFDKEKILKEHGITKASLKKVQKFFKDAPPAEEMVKLLTK